MIGRSKEVIGKLIVPALVLIHALFFVFAAWDVVRNPRDFSLSVGSGMVEGILVYLGVFSMPFILLLQTLAQYWELRKMTNYGALSPRSICLQVTILAIIAIRLFVKFGVHFPSLPNDGGGTFWRAFLTLFSWYFHGFMSYSLLMWIGGAGLVYFSTRSSKTDIVGQEVELGVFLE